MSMLPHSEITISFAPWSSSTPQLTLDRHRLILPIIMPNRLREMRPQIVHAVLVRVLSRRLILKRRQQDILPQRRIQIHEQGPHREDHVDGVLG